MVVVFHLWANDCTRAASLIRNSFLFVDFFFVLSGMVITLSYGRKLADGLSITRFMGLRLGRTYPLHAFMMVLFLAANLALGLAGLRDAGRGAMSPPDDVTNFFRNLFLVQIFSGPNGVYWNVPSWSIAAEIWTYLIFAFLFRHAGRFIVPIALAVAVAAALWLLSIGGIAQNHDNALIRSMYGFALGCLAAQLVLRWPGTFGLGSAAATSLEIGLVVAVILFVERIGAAPASVLAGPLFLIAVLTFAAERGGVSRLLMRRPFVLIGTLSYSVYMTHFFLERRIRAVMKLVEHRTGLILLVEPGRALPELATSAMVVFVTLSIVIAVAFLSYRWIERPGQIWSRGLILGRRRPSIDAAEARTGAF